jgi:hypothetical protein
MKRDMDLIRLLLLEYEGEEPKPDLSAYTQEQQIEHSALLIEAGFVHGEVMQGGTGMPVGTVVLRLTWAGHDFLAAARTESVWKGVGAQIKKAGVQVPLSILQELLKQYLKQTLGMP